MKIAAAIGSILLFISGPAALANTAADEIIAEFGIKTYMVTRKDSDFYGIFGENIYVKTRYCYEYAYGQKAIITKTKIIFIDGGQSCQIEGIYRK